MCTGFELNVLILIFAHYHICVCSIYYYYLHNCVQHTRLT